MLTARVEDRGGVLWLAAAAAIVGQQGLLAA
jgi:hypothetical protein